MMDLVPIDTFDATSLVSVETPYGRFAVAQVDESFYIFADVCTHAACPLSEGSLAGNVLTCECHFSEFELPSGRVLAEPAETDLVVSEVLVHGSMLTIEEAQIERIAGPGASPTQ
jgi:nitrite reductase/ring-hydroxylating ferredoxin subunit